MVSINVINLLLAHLIIIIIFFVGLLIILGSSSLQSYLSYLLTRKLTLRILIVAVAIELIASILILFQVTPTLKVQPAVYGLSFKYKNYRQAWIKSSTEEEKLCIENYIKNPTSRDQECKDYVAEYIRQEQVFERMGNGKANLECNNKVFLQVTPRYCSGTASYNFPTPEKEEMLSKKDKKKVLKAVSMLIDLKFYSNKKIKVEFVQEASGVKTKYINDITPRPKIEFSILATRKDNSDKFIGVLKHPDRKIDIADFVICTSNECNI